MGYTPKPGFKIGARKVNVEEYLPDVGDWEETNIVYDFGDGWLICEDRTEYDRRLMAKLTTVCIGTPNFLDKCIPFDEEGFQLRLDAQIERQRSYYPETPEGQEKFEAWAKNQRQLAQNMDKPRNGIGYYKFLHLRDPEQRPRACIFTALAEIVDAELRPPERASCYNGQHFPYISSRDLGQKHPIEIDGHLMHVIEIRIGTGNSAPLFALERCATWYADATGEWDQDAFEAVNPVSYGKVVTSHDLTPLKRKPKEG